MNGIPTRSLLEELDKGAFDHAVFLTYGLDLPFFEDSILHSLLRQESRNVLLFADGNHVATQLGHLAEMKNERKWRPCGKAYSLTSVRHQTAFHPKIALLVGEDVQLWVGSGNLEPGGLCSNLEIHNVAKTGADEGGDPAVAAMISNAWRYICGVSERNASEVVRRQLDEIEEAIPWVLTANNAATGDFRLVLGPDGDVLEEIAKEARGEKIDRIIILSPFFDKDFRTLKSLVRIFRPKKVQVLIQPDKTSMHGPSAQRLAGIDFYQLRSPNDRFAHAKVILFESRKREIVLAGSHNLSERAMTGENYEASVLQTALKPGEMLTHLRLDQDIVESNRVSKSGIAGMSIKVFEKDGKATASQIIASADMSNDQLRLRLRHEIKSKGVFLLVYDDSAIPKKFGRVNLNGDTVTVKVPPAAARGWAAVALEIDGKVLSPVPILNDLEILSRISNQRKFRDLARKASRTGTGLEEIEGLVEDLRSVLFDEWRRVRAGRRGAGGEEADELPERVRQLSYEDFVIPLKGEVETQKAAIGGDRSAFDAVLGAILASLGGTKVVLAGGAQPELEAEALPENLRALVDPKVEQEEQLAAEAAQAEGESEPQEDRRAEKQAQPSPEASTKDEPEAQFKAAEKYARKFARMAHDFPANLETRFQGDRAISIHEIEVLLTAARLFTGLVGRVYRRGIDEVVYLNWENWAKAQAGLLDVLTTNRLQVLKRLPWNRAGHAALRELHEGLAGWCLSIRGYLDGKEIEEETRLKLYVGLRLAGQLLGIEQGKLSKEGILDASRWILGHGAPGTPEPALNLDEWAREIGALRKDDLRLRGLYRQAGDIFKARSGLMGPEIGAWVWWPHVDGHIGLICGCESQKLEILYEVNESKTIRVGYVVKVGKNRLTV
jgi:hypothetical protein